MSDPFALTPASSVRPGDMMIWSYVTGAWMDDDRVTVTFNLFSGGSMINTYEPDALVEVTSVTCPKCGHRLNYNEEDQHG